LRGQVDGARGEAPATWRRGIAIPQDDVNREVRAALAEFPGAIKGVDDPDAIGLKASRVVRALLTQHRVVGTGLGEPGDDEFMTGPVGSLAEFIGPILVVDRSE